MRQYDYVDNYIESLGGTIGTEFRLADYRAWMRKNHPSQAGRAAMQLAVHREAPKKRVFTTECLRTEIVDGELVERVGMGRNAFYRVIETDEIVTSPAMLRMHLRESQEMVARWEREALNRMNSLAVRNKRAADVFEMAKAELRAVAMMLHARMRYFEGEEEEGKEEAA